MKGAGSTEKAELGKISSFIQHSTQVPRTVLELLCNTTIGTNGAQYQLKGTREHIYQLNQPHFFYFERHNRSVFNITICEREISLNNTAFHAFYIRYLAVQKIFHGGNSASQGNNQFHEYYRFLFYSNNLCGYGSNPNKKSMYWAYIDPENLRSFKMKEKFGFETIGRFTTWVFHRFFPKNNKAVVELNIVDLPLIIKETTKFYSNYGFLNLQRITTEDYFVFKIKGEIIAGCKCFPTSWKILQLPGKNGRLLKNILPFLPFSKRLINPDDNKFLATEGLWWKEGHASIIPTFLEGILYKTGLNSIYLWEDDAASKLKNLKIRWGMMQKIKADNPINIVAKFNDFEALEIESIKTSPKYLSGFDMT